MRERFINPIVPMSDQDRISPYNINQFYSKRVMRGDLVKYHLRKVPNSQS